MSIRRSLLPAFGTSLAFTLGGSGDSLAFQPQAGAVLTKSFSATSNLELDDLSLLVSGQDVAEMMGEISFTLEQETKIEVTDTYKASAGGRPTELLRTFDALSGDTRMEFSPNPGGVEMPDMASSSELEGKTVRFTWNEEEESYDIAFVEGEGDDALLEDLEEDMDLRVFLPSSEVAEDATWEVELVRLDTVLAPGGNLSLLPEDVEMDQEAMEKFGEMFKGFAEKYADQLEGKCVCTYKGMREEGEVRVAEIVIELEVAATLDLTEMLSQAIQEAIEQNGAGVEVKFSFDSADLNVDFDGAGTLLWNPAAGMVHSFQVGGDVTFGLDVAFSVEAMGESQDVDASLEMQGSMDYALATKR